MNFLEKPLRDPAQLENLLPHRAPMIMVGGLISLDDAGSVSEFKILDSNILVEDGEFTEAGLLETMAQTAALDVGFRNSLKNLQPREGYIVAIQKATITTLPKVDDVIYTELITLFENENLRKVNLTTKLNDQVIASAQMTTVLKTEEA